MTDRKYDEERSPKVLAFLNAIDALCREHGLSLGHEDRHGGFEVEPINEESQGWLLNACDITGDA